MCVPVCVCVCVEVEVGGGGVIEAEMSSICVDVGTRRPPLSTLHSPPPALLRPSLQTPDPALGPALSYVSALLFFPSLPVFLCLWVPFTLSFFVESIHPDGVWLQVFASISNRSHSH